MSFDGYFFFSDISRSKRIMKSIWKKEWDKIYAENSLKLFNSLELLNDNNAQPFNVYTKLYNVNINIKTPSYRAFLNKRYDFGDGSDWMEFELCYKEKRIFINTNWRRSCHHYINSKEVLEHCKKFKKEYDEL